MPATSLLSLGEAPKRAAERPQRMLLSDELYGVFYRHGYGLSMQAIGELSY